MNNTDDFRVFSNQDFQIKYQIKGNGQPLLLLHGFCGAANLWEDILPFLTPHFQCILPDLPGYGTSYFSSSFTDRCSVSQFTLSEYADAMLQLLDFLKIDDIIIVGHSMGGYIALEMMKIQSVSIQKIILLHSHPFGDDLEKKINRERAIHFIEKFGVKKFSDELYQQLFAQKFLEQEFEKINKLKMQAAKYTTLSLSFSLSGMKSRSDFSHQLSDFKTSLFQISGNEDKVIDRAITVKTALLPRVLKSVWMKKTGHMAMIERPKFCAQVILDFCIL